MTIRVVQEGGDGVAVAIEGNTTLGQLLFLSKQVEGQPLCAGAGRCGRCRVRITPAPVPGIEEREIFSESDLRAGWRLACRHQPIPGQEVFIPQTAVTHVEILPRIKNPFGLAIDLGTTTIKWSVMKEKDRVAQGSLPNPQLGAGSDIMARLAFAQASTSNAERLQGSICQWLESVISQTGKPDGLVVAGNSAMTALLLGLDFKGLATSPYHFDFSGGQDVKLPGRLPQAYIPPMIGPFIGGDISAGLCALTQAGTENFNAPSLLCDMGTNGEFVLTAGGHWWGTSVALGPALEGVGLSCGAPAGLNVITSFHIGPRGLIPAPAGVDSYTGIAGTGVLSLISLLMKLGLLDGHGRFQSGQTPLARRVSEGLREQHGVYRLELANDLFLTARDIEEVLKVKAAFNVGVASLLKEAAIDPNQLGTVFLAGALGEHVAVDDLLALGFFPPQLKERIRPVGNTALRGAEMLLFNHQARQWVKDLAQQVTVIDLASQPLFQEMFIQSMRFGHVGSK